MTTQYEAEVRETERAFAQMAREQGVQAAFLAFAAEDAVLLRGKQLIAGKAAIAAFFDRQTLQNVTLDWEPHFVDVSAAGDLAYTYGPYHFSATDASGNPVTDSGIFHTVWRRQADGRWRYVWD